MCSSKLTEPDGVARALQVLHDYFAPDALDAVYQDVARFLGIKRPTQSIDECLAKVDLLRRKAEYPMQTGGAFPEAFASVLCLRNAFLSRAETPLVCFAAEFGDRRNRAANESAIWTDGRQWATGCVARGDRMQSPSEDEDLEAWAAYCKAKKKSENGGEGAREGAEEYGGRRGRGKIERDHFSDREAESPLLT